MSASSLRLELKAPASSPQGEPLWVEVAIRNLGAAPALVNGRMVVDEPEGLDGYYEVTFEVTGPSGKALPFMLEVDGFEPQASDFVLLAASGSHSRRIRLDKYFRFNDKGSYTVAVTYRNTVAQERDGTPAFVGTLHADRATITIE